MPEGDTVWRAAHRLHDALAGRALTRSDVRVPQWATLDLRGVTVDDAVSRGKHLFIRAGDVSLHTHLKMEGVWHVYPHGGRSVGGTPLGEALRAAGFVPHPKGLRLDARR